MALALPCVVRGFLSFRFLASSSSTSKNIRVGQASQSQELLQPAANHGLQGCVYGPQRTSQARTMDGRQFVQAQGRYGFQAGGMEFGFTGIQENVGGKQLDGQDR